MDYLCLALIWGDGPGLLQPQRNDMRTFRFYGDGDGIDKTKDNFISLDPAL